MASLVRWVWSVALTLLGLALVTFAMTRLSPIDPALQLVGDHASQSTYQQARQELGLDQALPIQFLHYLGTALSGNLGQSISTGQPVAKDIARTFPATVELATVAILIGAGLGLALGIAAAMRQGTWIDSLCRLVSLVGYSVPIFWLGLLMLLLFYARLHWAPGPGRADVVFQYTVKPVTGFALVDTLISGKAGAFVDAIAHLALPAGVLALHSIAAISRLTRASIITELGQEYVTTAREGGGALACRIRSCPAKPLWHDTDSCRPFLRKPVGRRGTDRDRFCVARHRTISDHGHVRRRHARDPRRDTGCGRLLRAPQCPDRHWRDLAWST